MHEGVTDDTLTTLDSDEESARSRRAPDKLALVCVWSSEPGRVGEVLGPFSPGSSLVFGRTEGEDDQARVTFVRQRPDTTEQAAPLHNPYLSRSQLRIRSDRDTLYVENLGKRALLDPDGAERDKVTLSPGQCIEVRGQLVLLCAKRPDEIPKLRSIKSKKFPSFGEADDFGFVGESPVAWAVRDRAAFVAGTGVHVLLLGESGTGKEVIAQAIHAQSSRAQKRMVSRNAATLPTGIIDAELFGNIANYPNPGTPDRPGLIGEADGSTLFLDEIGELPEEMQTRLLRVLDDRGEYQKLGEAKRRTSDLRFIGATNRPKEALKHDLAARLRLTVELPGLGERREDIMLVARFLLRRIARDGSSVADRFCDKGEPRFSSALARALVMHEYSTHVRELDALLWRAIESSKGDTLELTEEVEQALDTPKEGKTNPQDLTADDVRAALARAGGSREKAWRDLGLANRHVLKRLIKKLGIE